MNATMTSKDHGLDSPAEKSYVEQKEDIEKGERRRQSATKHGDRALAIIGDERVSLTDEDVRRSFTTFYQSALLVVLQALLPYVY